MEYHVYIIIIFLDFIKKSNDTLCNMFNTNSMMLWEADDMR